MTQGYIYVLTNTAMPGVVKIGRTVRNPLDRARELRTTGVPVHFDLVHSVLVPNCEETEKFIHQILAKRGVRTLSDREFFEVSAEEAIDLIHTLTFDKSSDKPNFEISRDLAEMMQAIAVPMASQNIADEAADRLALRLTEIGRRGYPAALKACAELFLYSCPSTARFREYWQEYLTMAQDEAKWKRLDGANGRMELQRLGGDACEYLVHLHQRRWLLPTDFNFISGWLVAGERFAYEGYIEELSRAAFPENIRLIAENL